MRRLKVTHVIYALRVGGLENGLVNLINSTSSAIEHSIVCLTDYGDFRTRIRADDVPIIALGKRPGQDLGCMFRLAGALRRIRPDILHTRNLGTLDIPPVGMLAGVGIRIHGEHGWDMMDLDGTVARYRWLRRSVNPFVTKFMAVSRHLVDWLVTEVGIDRGKIAHITNGVDVEVFRRRGRVDAELRARRELAGEAVVLGTVGRLQPVKNQEILLRACAELTRVVPGGRQRFALWIAGDGPERRRLETLAQQLGIEDITWFLGERPDIAQVLRCLDVFVLPSRNEGVSNTILEAMATGLPVVATQVGGNAELVDDNVTGLLTAPNKASAVSAALARYLTQPGLRREHGNAGRARVEREFSLQTMVTKYLALYRSVSPVHLSTFS